MLYKNRSDKISCSQNQNNPEHLAIVSRLYISPQNMKKLLVAFFMLSTWVENKYRKNKYIDTIWKECHKITNEHFYYIGARDVNRNSITETLLTKKRGKRMDTEPTGLQTCFR